MGQNDNGEILALGHRLVQEVLDPMKRSFVGKDEIIDLMGVALVAGENLFLLGPPGTAKSALVFELGRRLRGPVFEYLLTRFTEPNEIFGPFDIRRLREGELVTNTEGMLPEASLVFLDELLNANSAILNSLLMALNERVFRRGREKRDLSTLIIIGASNRLPEDEALNALFDRFLLRVTCDNVEPDRLVEVLERGWKLDLKQEQSEGTLEIEDVRRLHHALVTVDLAEMRSRMADLVTRLRHAGLPLSDRRAVKLQRLVAASALLCGRQRAVASDLWVFRYVWDTVEQKEVLAAIVQDVLKSVEPANDDHPRARGNAPDAEALARELEELGLRACRPELTAADRSLIRDRLGLLSSRCQWVFDERHREVLNGQVEQLWSQLEEQS